MLCAAWAALRRPGKAEAGFFRAAAYLNAGCPEQALKDARYALVYGPQVEGAAVTSLVPGSASAAAADGAGASGGAAGAAAAPAPAPSAQALSGWPAGLALLSAAHEGLADNVPAALAMQVGGRGGEGGRARRCVLQRTGRFAQGNKLAPQGTARRAPPSARSSGRLLQHKHNLPPHFVSPACAARPGA